MVDRWRPGRTEATFSREGPPNEGTVRLFEKIARRVMVKRIGTQVGDQLFTFVDDTGTLHISTTQFSGKTGILPPRPATTEVLLIDPVPTDHIDNKQVYNAYGVRVTNSKERKDIFTILPLQEAYFVGDDGFEKIPKTDTASFSEIPTEITEGDMLTIISVLRKATTATMRPSDGRTSEEYQADVNFAHGVRVKVGKLVRQPLPQYDLEAEQEALWERGGVEAEYQLARMRSSTRSAIISESSTASRYRYVTAYGEVVTILVNKDLSAIDINRNFIALRDISDNPSHVIIYRIEDDRVLSYFLVDVGESVSGLESEDLPKTFSQPSSVPDDERARVLTLIIPNLIPSRA